MYIGFSSWDWSFCLNHDVLIYITGYLILPSFDMNMILFQMMKNMGTMDTQVIRLFLPSYMHLHK